MRQTPDLRTQLDQRQQAGDIPGKPAPQIAPPIFAEEHKDGPVGIGGWFILPILHLITSIGMTMFNLWSTPWAAVKIIMLSDVPEISGMKLPMLMSLFAGLVLIGWCTMALVQIFNRSPRVPRTMTIFYLGMIVLVGIETLADSMLSSATGEPMDPFGKELFRAIIAAAVWIPYFRMSKRVANTFKNRGAKVNEQLDRIVT